MRPLLLVVLALAALPAAAQSPGAPGIERAAFTPGETTDPAASACAALADGTRACRVPVPCADDADACPDTLRFTLARAGQTLATWTHAGVAFGSEGFDLLRTDLDADGARELVVAYHDGTSNGLGVSYWTLFVFPEAGGPPLRFSTQEYGAEGTFPRAVRAGRRVLVTGWEGSSEPGRGAGTYFFGRTYRYAAGRLVPDAAPIRARRLLNGFARERGRPGPRDPAGWLSRNARSLLTEPLAQGRALAEVSGRVETVAISDTGMTVTLRPARGAAVAVPAFAFGDAATRRLYPFGYVPADEPAWPSGLAARAVTYATPGPYGTPLTVVWLGPR